MGIEHGGVERVVVVLDGLVVEAVHIVHLEEVRGGPVGIAMHDPVGEAVVVVGEVVERDGHPVVGAQCDDIVAQPVVVDYGLQGVYHWMVHFVGLGLGGTARYE